LIRVGVRDRETKETGFYLKCKAGSKKSFSPHLAFLDYGK
jgi:hypothetical protein